MGRRSEVSTSVVKGSVGFSNRVIVIIIRYIDHLQFAVYMAVCFITYFSYTSGSVLYHFIYGCVFFVFLFNSVSYVF